MKDFLKYVLANFVAFAIVGGACFIVFLMFLGSLMMSGETVVDVPRSSILVLNLSSPIVDKPISEDLQSLMAEIQGKRVHVMNLHDVLRGLDLAVNDDRIKALYLTGNVGETSWASLSEIRAAIVRFKARKPVIAYNQTYQETDYYLASAASEVLMHPNGLMELNGFASQVMFFKNAFEKYGIDVQVTRVGKYKAAVEPLIQDKMSDANREQLETLLNDLYNQFIDTIAQDRRLDPLALHELGNTNALLTQQMVVEKGLVDRLTHYDEVLELLSAKVGKSVSKDFQNQISIRKYVEARSLEPVVGKGDQVLVVYAEGNIVDGSSNENAGGDEIAALLRQARFDDRVKAVVLRVNSPGGTVSASEVIGREARLLREVKPVVVSMGGVAASGGYWISSHADEIFALPNTITGSIGVFGFFTNFQKVMAEHGVTVDVAKTSERADTLTMLRPKNEQELANLQAYVDESYGNFIDMVATGRKLDPEAVREIAQGRVWSGSRAKDLGLVDSLGGLEDAVAAAAKRANLADYQWVEYQKATKFADELVARLEDQDQFISAAPAGPMAQTLENLKQTWKQLAMFDKPAQAYALLPFTLKIR